jgi:hypothetical protein
MSTRAPALRLAFASVEAMRDEYQRNLRAGGAFCPGADPLPERSECLLVLVHPATGAVLELAAEVVFVQADGPGRGLGLHIRGFGAAVKRELLSFVGESAEARAAPAKPIPRTDEPEPALEEPEREAAHDRPGSQALHERIRGLPLAAQLKLAREGNLNERVALERILGKTVWEALLQNQRVTPPEVARIARMGTATAAILETIAAGAAWLASGEVRRALLGNARLPEEAMHKALRATPRSELLRIRNQTFYPPRVRKAVKALLSKV